MMIWAWQLLSSWNLQLNNTLLFFVQVSTSKGQSRWRSPQTLSASCLGFWSFIHFLYFGMLHQLTPNARFRSRFRSELLICWPVLYSQTAQGPASRSADNSGRWCCSRSSRLQHVDLQWEHVLNLGRSNWSSMLCMSMFFSVRNRSCNAFHIIAFIET